MLFRSDMGFNRTIVGDDMLIVKQILPKSFADVVADIVDKGRIQELSQRAYNRIRSNYTEDIVYNRMKEEYSALLR